MTETPPVQFRKVTLVGVGLLGGSLGLALKERGLAVRVVGYVRREASVRECLQAGAVDEATCDLQVAIHGADLVVLCTPLAQMETLARQFLPSLKKGAIVTDVGSVKGSVARNLEKPVAQAGGHFVGSHPMAGSEKTGVGAARSDLFQNAVCVVTPTGASKASAVRRIRLMWERLGGRVLTMGPELHDQLVSRSSHLTYMVAAQLAATVLDPRHGLLQPALCASGFRDTTRVASGSPEMWRDIVAANRRNLDRALGVYIRQLQRLHHLIRSDQGKKLESFLARTKERRDSWKRGQSTPETQH